MRASAGPQSGTGFLLPKQHHNLAIARFRMVTIGLTSPPFRSDNSSSPDTHYWIAFQTEPRDRDRYWASQRRLGGLQITSSRCVNGDSFSRCRRYEQLGRTGRSLSLLKRWFRENFRSSSPSAFSGSLHQVLKNSWATTTNELKDATAVLLFAQSHWENCSREQ